MTLLNTERKELPTMNSISSENTVQEWGESRHSHMKEMEENLSPAELP